MEWDIKLPNKLKELFRGKNKLLFLINRAYFKYLCLFLLISMIGLFLLMYFMLNHEAEESLETIEYSVVEALYEGEEIKNISPILEVKEVNQLKKKSFENIEVFDPRENEEEDFLQYTSYRTIGNKHYQIIVRSKQVEADHILSAIAWPFLAILVLVMVMFYFLNKKLNKELWAPFFYNLSSLKEYNITKSQKIDLKESKVEEFNELNENLIALTNKVASDYMNLKQFTEDASHEIQTPLAIVQAQIENLIDADIFEKENMESFDGIRRNVKRLSRLNKSLLLLTKIENKQFDDIDEVNLVNALEDTLDNLKDLATAKEINMELLKTSDFQYKMNANLADVLFTNLISNAIKYTENSGRIKIHFKVDEIQFMNTGNEKIQDAHQIFNRFFKTDKSAKSLGLGLSIVKKVCEVSNININYYFADGFHIFSLKFKKQL